MYHEGMQWLAILLLAQAKWQEENRLGEEAFRRADIAASLKHFDRAIEMEPRLKPQHWQRGISLYYAKRYNDCRRQFELHRTVNPEDVENAAWHFLCTARAASIGEARKKLIPVRGDVRIPMSEVQLLYAGKSTVERVLSAAGADRSGLFYAHLYIGLYYEAAGEVKAAGEHIRKAAEDYGADHYMGDVARVHLKLWRN